MAANSACWRWHAIKCSVFAGLVVLSIRSAIAASLSFQTALVLAEQNAPSLAAESDAIESAQSSLVSAGRLPDPKLFLGIESFPVSGPPAGTFDDNSAMGRVGIMQEVPNTTKRHAQIDIAEANVRRVEADREVERLRVRREVAVAWLTRYYLERKDTLLAELERENKLLADAITAQLAANEASAPDTVIPKQEAAMLAGRRDELARDIAQAKAALRHWVGDAADNVLAGDPPNFTIDHRSLRHHLDDHPELAAYSTKSAVAQAEVREATAAKIPDWGVELSYGRRDPAFGDVVSLQVSIDLPLFTSKRQNPRIAAKQAEVNQIDAERQALLLDHAQELESDVAEHDRLDRAVDRQQSTFIPLAQEKVSLAMAAYGAGNSTLTDVLAARRELIDSRLKLIDLQSQQAQLTARLHYTFEEGK
ncbi:MAG: TolC family protein [Gammaproteobacteria bacterium]